MKQLKETTSALITVVFLFSGHSGVAFTPSFSHRIIPRLGNVARIARSEIRSDSLQEAERVTFDDDGDNSSAANPASQAGNKDELFSWTEQWYPILPESYLQDQPIPLTLLEKDLVIWKTSSGEISVLEDSCPHRRAPLSTGKIVSDQLACRYHGWRMNPTGICTEIPMDGSQKFSGKFCAKSYHAQVKGGLLWVFMSPDVVVPPPIPQGAADDNGADDGWMIYTSPVSFLSQIENSFDPTHAPFTHEGSNSFGSEGFSPQNALAMERYELIEPSTISGFALEHSPYQKMPPGSPEITTVRKFVAPCTTVVKSPFFSTNLHFVPSKPGETLIVINFGGGGSKTRKGVQKLVRKMTPKRLRIALKDFVHFAVQVSESRFRFVTQDQQTMQGQDYRKVNDKTWSDMTPTASDAGVKALQRWMGRFGDFGPFPIESSSAHQRKDMSIWDSHGKFCPQCQSTIKRLARLEKVAGKLSTLLLGASLFGGTASSLLMAVQKSFRTPAIGLLLPVFTLFLVLSIVFRSLSQYCSKLMADAFVTRDSDARLRTMEIYSP